MDIHLEKYICTRQVQSRIDNIISQLPVSPEKLQEFQDNTANDTDL